MREDHWLVSTPDKETRPVALPDVSSVPVIGRRIHQSTEAMVGTLHPLTG